MQVEDSLNKIIVDLQTAFDSFDKMEDAYYDFMPIADKIVARFQALPNPIESLPHIFELIEHNVDAENGLGAPGQIGNFLEEFYGNGYEKHLLDSIKRKPTSYTIFLLQRIIRDEKNSNRGKHLSLLNKMTTDKNLTLELREEIIDTLKDFV
jgi:hypothetical protein